MSAIDDLPPLRDVIRRHDLFAKKSLGQNFLLDLNLTARIARAEAVYMQSVNRLAETAANARGEARARRTLMRCNGRRAAALRCAPCTYPRRLDASWAADTCSDTRKGERDAFGAEAGVGWRTRQPFPAPLLPLLPRREMDVDAAFDTLEAAALSLPGGEALEAPQPLTTAAAVRTLRDVLRTQPDALWFSPGRAAVMGFAAAVKSWCLSPGALEASSNGFWLLPSLSSRTQSPRCAWTATTRRLARRAIFVRSLQSLWHSPWPPLFLFVRHPRRADTLSTLRCLFLRKYCFLRTCRGRRMARCLWPCCSRLQHTLAATTPLLHAAGSHSCCLPQASWLSWRATAAWRWLWRSSGNPNSVRLR